MVIVDTSCNFSLTLKNKSIEESIMPSDINLRILGVDVVEVGFRHNLEQESEDTSTELRDSGLLSLLETIESFWISSWIMLLLKLMDNVHFKIKKDTINRVLTRSMEMELKSVKLGLWNMRIIQRDGLSGNHVFILSLSGNFVDIDVPLPTG